MSNEDLYMAVKNFKTTCFQNNVVITDEKDIPYGKQFKVKHENEIVQVNLYFGKKGLQIVIQGKDSPTKHFIKEIFDKNDKQEISSSDIKYIYDKPWIGIDESGKGDFFGPLVCTGVLLKPADIKNLELLGVRDSKKISDNRILEISDQLKLLLNNRISSIVLRPYKYNELYMKMKNLNSILAWCHSTVLENLLQKQMVELAISDKFGDVSLINNRLKKLGKEINLIQETKAEKNLAVAAASIIARSEYLLWLKHAEEKYNLKFPKGAASSVVEAGKTYSLKYGFENLNEVTKLHFKTINDI
ncbi:ribonuclease HIII [Gottfriedia sp. S16(2024)]|uniref:ribonuclease HIII n=1 Tax=Gottfriedia sp. S16(2024) TaxID=3162883 RepID=UPI003D228419